MKSLTLALAIMAGFFTQAHADAPFAGNVKELGIVAESKNASGEKLLVREMKVQPERDTPGNAVDRRYYRLEFWTHNVLFHAHTIWKDRESKNVTMKWASDSECEITLIPGWSTVTFFRDKWEHWTYSRRID